MRALKAINSIDFYKSGHKNQYPDGTEYVYSNFTPRTGKYANTGLGGIIHFGLQGLIKWLFIDLFNDTFFSQPVEGVVADYSKRMNNALGENVVTPEHIIELHELGYLPLKIKSLPEGSFVPYGVPTMTVINTLKKFSWLTNYVESITSSELWRPCTSATTAFAYRLRFNELAKATGTPADFVPWQGHDFSFRGMGGVYDSMASGAGHLLSFFGTDSVPAIDYLEEYYSADSSKELVGGSVPASEHSVQCMHYDESDGNELAYLDHMLDLYKSGIFSIVMDGFDFWGFLTETMPLRKDEIMAREGRVVVRPDCYDDNTQILTNMGFMYFRDIDADTLVAQVLDDSTYEFVKPLKVVNEEYDGDMVRISDSKGKVDILVTPEHRVITYKGEEEKIIFAKDMNKKGYWPQSMKRSAMAQSNTNRTLSDIERIKIAFQADGSFQSRGNKIRFSFSKKRKIDRMKSLLGNSNTKYKIYQLKDGRCEFNIDLNSELFVKDFSWVDTKSLTCEWSKGFIEELSHWGSHIRSEHRIKFDTTNESVIEVVELVSIAAGYGVFISKYEDNRKDLFSDVYTAHIMHDNRAGGQSWAVENTNYKGRIHCVTVPSGRVVVKRNRSVLVCGNSGDPVDIICGTVGSWNSENPTNKTPEQKGAYEILWDTFGGTVNEQGFKVLDTHVGLIYGDSITLERQRDILNRLRSKGFCASNLVMGVGSFSYAYTTRDTHGFAMKATWGSVNGVGKEIFKSPKTGDGMKKSAKGLLKVIIEDGQYKLIDQVSKEEEETGCLETVFLNGKLVKETTLSEIRDRVAANL